MTVKKFVSSALPRVTCAGGLCSAWALMTAMLSSAHLLCIPGRSGLFGLPRNVRQNVDPEPDREIVKKQTDVSEKVARLTDVGIRNVSGQLGKSGQIVLRSVGEVD